jgi:hypothetical protein
MLSENIKSQSVRLYLTFERYLSAFQFARMKKSKSAEKIAEELNLPVSWVGKYMA